LIFNLEGIISMTEHIVVWDLETVPDLIGYARANGLQDQDPEFIRKAIGDAFPKLIYHSIVCIGAVIAKFDGGHWVTVAVGAPNVGDRSGKELITAFVDRLDTLRPQLISFNGNAFDLPVLRYRAMIAEVSAPALSKRGYFNRYTTDCLDLCDVLASFNPSGRIKLDALAKILGFAGKPADLEGSQVEEYFNAGRISDIASYCESDVINTYRIWLRYELFRGALTSEGYERSQASLQNWIDRSGIARRPVPMPFNGPQLAWPGGAEA
jgi:predicted PolB exonuclease-like 3'-5' exonuclease